MYQLPMAFQKASTAMVFVVELLVPLLFFAPRPLRQDRRLGDDRAAGADPADRELRVLQLSDHRARDVAVHRAGAHRPVAGRIGLAVLIGIVSLMVSLEQLSIPLPPGGGDLLHLVTPLRIVNSYGLFASMTTTRPEIIVEGSRDGVEWLAYEFRYKPGDLNRMPPVVAPHQPRLDWQMWFAALGHVPEQSVVREFHGDGCCRAEPPCSGCSGITRSPGAAEICPGAAI